MALGFSFDLTKPVIGEAKIDIATPIQRVFRFIGEQFFENYPKWAEEVVEFQPLDGSTVTVGAKAKQVREDQSGLVESIFEITELQPETKLVVAGVNAPYKQSYLLSRSENPEVTQLTFRFEILELEVFMRPFEKLIRYAIEEGAENTVDNIQRLLVSESANAS